jgi:flavin reductase (DIM6/NTAB) family NADH-FMN oxidoreductase RutF
MPEFDTSAKEPLSIYKLIIGSVVPRPIAFVSSVSPEGVANLAPFSFFNAVCNHPPTILFSVVDRKGEKKDTVRNVEAHPEFIVHIVSEAIAEKMNVTCGDYGAHVSEFVEAGFTAVPGTRVRVPRVAEAQVAMECRLTRIVDVGVPPDGAHVVFGEVIHWHVQDGLLDSRERVDADKLRAVGRMGGIEYTRTRDRFSLDRPVIPDEDPRSVAAFRRMQGGTSPK